MTGSGGDSIPPSPTEDKQQRRSDTASYVYPVRSLLSGRFQQTGASDQSPRSPPSTSSAFDNDAGVAGPSATNTINLDSDEGDASTPMQGGTSTSLARRLSLDLGHGSSTVGLQKSNSSVGELSSMGMPNKPKKARHASKRSKDTRATSPNFRHFPAEGSDPNEPRSFVSNPHALSSSSSLASDRERYGGSTTQTFVAGPTGEPVAVNAPMSYDTGQEEQEFPHKHLTQISELTGDAFSTMQNGPFLAPSSADPPPDPPEEAAEPDMPFNPSEYGIVHLAPVPSKPASMDGGSQGSGSRHGSQTSRYSTAPSSQNKQRSQGSGVVSPDAAGSGSESQSQYFTGGSGSAPDSGSREAGSTEDSQASSSTGSSVPLMTMRYQHLEDENGNHLVVGREGQLTKCEDEPIRTPGAVQGFGVLIAVDEDNENGNLIVRQVSENSTELLGLSPKYLFSLECFTEALPDAQADILWDNIQYLQEPDPDQDESPHVFTLTGWGEVGSALPGEPTSDGKGRRSWTCWCGVHRPQADPAVQNNIIILEFELERDTKNPLYPISNDLPSANSTPATGSSMGTSVASLGSGSGGESVGTGGSSTDDSESTLVAHEDLTPPAGGPPVSNERISNQSAQENIRLPTAPASLAGLDGSDEWIPSAEDILESTTTRAKPIPALERLRRMSRNGQNQTPVQPAPHTGAPSGARARRAARANTSNNPASGVGMMDVFAVMSQINEQLGAAPDLDSFLKVVAGVIKDLSQFHRVLVYQFDESWNGQVVAELVDWSHSHDLYKGLHFPAADIPAQARELYAINKVRLLYDRSQATARIVVRSKEDLETPLNMTHCYLRAMSPIHIKYLANMGVRASMSVSIMAFGHLWGLITCHSYGTHRMRVSFPVRQMLRLLSQSISRNIERLSYAQRLHTRRLINTMASDNHPTGHIVSNADDLLGLFDADYGILVIGEGAKILGPNLHGQEILVMAEFLRLKQYETIKVSQAVTKDFPGLELSTGLEVIAGLLYVPLSSGGKDFIAFLRKGQPRDVHWAGRPKLEGDSNSVLEPRKSFKIWSEVVAGRCRAWTDEQMETAGVLSLVYGKFIEVWRQKESALQTTKLTNILLSNASHEVRTPLNHIINYLEMALDGPLDLETRDNLSMSHAASKSLLFTINDLLDLTRLESGNETSLNESFNLQSAIDEATRAYRNEAGRRQIDFKLEISDAPTMVIGDIKKIKTVVSNLTANSLKYTTQGSITVRCHTYGEPEGLRAPKQTAVEILVADTGCGIPSDKLESIFREFEQVESSGPAKSGQAAGLGLGLAVVARIVEQLGGQLRVDSNVDRGSQFSFLIPLTLCDSSTDVSRSPSSSRPLSASTRSRGSRGIRSRNNSSSGGSELDSLVEALQSNHMGDAISPHRSRPPSAKSSVGSGIVPVAGSIPLRPIKMDTFEMDASYSRTRTNMPPGESSLLGKAEPPAGPALAAESHAKSGDKPASPERIELRVLIVEDNDINRRILGKRLTKCGHTVVNTTNGQEGLDKVVEDGDFDCVLMDLQMPILDGFEATERIREFEKTERSASLFRRLSQKLNGRIPIFAVSASLIEQQYDELCDLGMDGWILKPIDFKRLDIILKGVTDLSQRNLDLYRPGCSWEIGGWLVEPQHSHSLEQP